MIGNSNDETNFLVYYKISLTDNQASKTCKAVASNSSANIKPSKTQLSKMVVLEEFAFAFSFEYIRLMKKITRSIKEKTDPN